MRSRADALAIPPERCFCTGDVVAYGADPAMSIELIRDWGVNVIAGNCELALADAAFNCGCGFQAGSAGEAIGDLFGYTLYHASLDPDEYRALLADAGFRVLRFTPEDPECGGHSVWLAAFDGN